jgi:hypothetical protein
MLSDTAPHCPPRCGSCTGAGGQPPATAPPARSRKLRTAGVMMRSWEGQRPGSVHFGEHDADRPSNPCKRQCRPSGARDVQVERAVLEGLVDRTARDGGTAYSTLMRARFGWPGTTFRSNCVKPPESPADPVVAARRRSAGGEVRVDREGSWPARANVLNCHHVGRVAEADSRSITISFARDARAAAGGMKTLIDDRQSAC